MIRFLKGLGLFTVGAVIGGVITKKYMEKARELEQEESMSNPSGEQEDLLEEEEVDEYVNMTFKEYYEGESGRPLTRNTRSRDKEEYESIRVRYDTIIKGIEETNEKAAHYNDDVESFSDHPNYNGKATPIEVKHDPTVPYFIEEGEFGILDDWDSNEYTLYKDGYVTDEYGLPVDNEDVDGILGVDFHTRLEQDSRDEVWIRNEVLRIDISIARDLANFEDVAPLKVKRMMGWI